MDIAFVNVFGVKVFSDDLEKISFSNGECKAINTISPNSYGISVKDKEFEAALKKTDYLVLDGVYFALASICLQGKNIKKNQGPDVFSHFMKQLSKASGKAFFLGSSESVLERIRHRSAKEFPEIQIGCLSPPFKNEFTEEDNSIMVSKINAFKPDIVFVGMTAPKQEKWAIQNRDRLNAGLVISIGNVFDWYAGTQKAIHPFWFKIRMGWLVRIFLRPSIFKRNIKNQMTFFWHLFLIIVKLKKNKFD